METKLFVGNLSYSTTEETLREVFSQAGTVTLVELINNRDTGRSKGFAFITMGSQNEMEKAITTLNGKMVENRELKVSIAKPREERPRGEWYSNNPADRFGKRDNRGSNRKGSGGGTRRY